MCNDDVVSENINSSGYDKIEINRLVHFRNHEYSEFVIVFSV
jgi:hypothetical protein